MKQLIQFLLADEKIVAQLTTRHDQFKKNMANETGDERETRMDLHKTIVAMKKANSKIVNHCLKERRLTDMEIEQITKEHLEPQKQQPKALLRIPS